MDCSDAVEAVEVETDEVPEVAGSEAMFNEFIAEAGALPEAEVVAFKGNASLAFHNVDRGVKAVMPHRETMERLPGIDVGHIERLPNVALAMVFAHNVTQRGAGVQSSGETKRLLSQAAASRRLMLLALETSAEAGLVPHAEVKPIRAGSGPLDMLGDVNACIALFRRYEAALAGKTPVTKDHLREASEVSAALQSALKPAGTPTLKQARPLKELEDERNRLWTLLVRGHADMRKVAGFLWGEDASKHVPALQSRLRIRKPAAPSS